MAFERAVIGLFALATLAQALVAYKAPKPQVTFAPRAVLPAAIGAGQRNLRLAARHPAPGFTVGTLTKTFSSLNYDLDSLREGTATVPRLFVVSLPADMNRIRVPEKRKWVFLNAVLPLVLKINDEIRATRRRVETLMTKRGAGARLSAEARLWLAALAERYGTGRDDLAALLSRVDNIPPSLALAQAAEESGWGTSRFVLEGNALFGQWTFAGTQNLIPTRRDAGRSHGVKAFTNLLDAVRAYMHNLNTHRAYRKFRSMREKMRLTARPADGLALVGSLTNYSVRGKKYIRSIRAIITTNRLLALDKARLGGKLVKPPSSKPAI